MNRDIKTGILAALVVLMIIAICTATGQAADRSNRQLIGLHPRPYPGTEFKSFVITELDTFAIYKATWGAFDREVRRRVPGYNGVYLAFSDRNTREIWYTEGILDKVFGRFKWYKTPLEAELINVGSYKAWNEAAKEDRDYEESIKRANRPMFRYDLKGRPID